MPHMLTGCSVALLWQAFRAWVWVWGFLVQAVLQQTQCGAVPTFG
jgi:hypothetical protein